MALHTIRSTNRIKIVVVTGEPVHCRRAEAGAWPVRRKEPGFPVKTMAQSSRTERQCPDHLPCGRPRIPFGVVHRSAANCANPRSGRPVLMLGDCRERVADNGVGGRDGGGAVRGR